jgi:hypothetical protein
MYVIPLLIILLIALAIFFSPILAVVLLVVALIGIGVLKFLGGGAVDAEHAAPPADASSPPQAPGRAAVPTDTADEERSGGLWGEEWPEQRSSEH